MKKIGVISLLLLLAICAGAQDTITLRIGDDAPALKYSKWLKGQPVEHFRNDHVYVLEFWATWCGPCIAAMPHLSELSEKYRNKATFIGVNVLEKTGDQPYETALPMVSRFVSASGYRMRYNVVADNNARAMYNLWMKSAGLAVIPNTIVVSKGKVVWIGHPSGLDSVMEPIVEDRFDVAAFKKVHEKNAQQSFNSTSAILATFETLKKIVETGDYDSSFNFIDASIKKIPLMKMPLNVEKFKIMIAHFPVSEALGYADSLIKQDTNYLGPLALAVAEKDGLPSNMYMFAADGFNKVLEKQPWSMLYDKLAICYSKVGKWDAAVKAEEKAVQQAKVELTDPEYAGRVFNYTITDYEKTLEKYRNAVK